MKWKAESEALKPYHFLIKHDPSVGFYLYVFEGNKCVRDHLQDAFEIAVNTAFEDYDVPESSWEKI